MRKLIILLFALKLTNNVCMGQATSPPRTSDKTDNWSSCCIGNECTSCTIANTNHKDRNYDRKKIAGSMISNTIESGGRFNDCTFENTTIDNLYISKAEIKSCSFRNSRINKLTIRNSNIDGLVFENTTILDLSFVDGTLKNLTFKNTQGSRLIFKGKSPIDGLDITDSQLEDIKLTGLVIQNSRIMASDLKKADLNNSSWSNSLIVGTDLSTALVEGLQFQSVDTCRTTFDWSNFGDAEPTFCESSSSYCFDNERYVYRNGEEWQAKVNSGKGQFTCVDGLKKPKEISCDRGYTKMDRGCEIQTCTTSDDRVLLHGRSAEVTSFSGDIWIEKCDAGSIKLEAPPQCPSTLYRYDGHKCQHPCNYIEPGISEQIKVYGSDEGKDIIIHCPMFRPHAPWTIVCKKLLNARTNQYEQTYFGGCYRTPSDSPVWQIKPFTWKTSVSSSEVPSHIPPRVCMCRFREAIENDRVSLNIDLM